MSDDRSADNEKSASKPNDGRHQEQSKNGKGAGKTEDAITLLKNDHRTVEQLFQQYKQAQRRTEKQRIVRQICQELIIHTKLEEEIFYPACRQQTDDDEALDEAQVEHDGAKVLINELIGAAPEQPFYDAKVMVLSEMIKHHVNEEEKRNDGVFAKAKAAGVDTDEIARRLAARKAELAQQAEQQGLERPRPRSFNSSMEASMARGQYRERDEYGRFMSDDYDDRRSSRSSRGRMPERDEYGRFMSDDDDDRRSSYRSRGSRYEDDEYERGRSSRSMGARSGGGRSRYEDEGRGEGRGGWFGDSEGHAEASRQGWQRSDHEGSGWYGDPEGHSQASRRGWRRSDHEGSGWYGDPEGHAEASRRGWEERGRYGRSRSRYEDDDRGYSSRSRSRSRYEDDDDDRGRGRGRGGWFGDPEGHSEAARRGWDERR